MILYWMPCIPGMRRAVTPVPPPIESGARQTFTHEVEFLVTNMTWPREWESYFWTSGLQLHGFAIANSVITVILLAGFLLVGVSRKAPKGLYDYEHMDKGIQASMSQGTLEWKVVMGDTFGKPRFSKLPCVMVGSGVQIASMGIVTMILATFGFKSLRSEGRLLTAMTCILLVFGFVAGYAGIWPWTCIRGSSDGWRSVSWSTAHFFTSISFSIFIVLNIIYHSNGSTAAVSFSVYLTLLALWFCVSVPLTYLGGFMATRSQEQIQLRVEFEQNPRETPKGQTWSRFLILAAGVLPFGATFVELTFVFPFFWVGRYYAAFGFLFTAALFLVIICAEVSMIATYWSLCTKDWKWWWKAFFASGSTGFYFFLYSVNYLLFDLRGFSNPSSTALYLGYSTVLALAMVLSTGAIGFLAAFCFLRNPGCFLCISNYRLHSLTRYDQRINASFHVSKNGTSRMLRVYDSTQ